MTKSTETPETDRTTQAGSPQPAGTPRPDGLHRVLVTLLALLAVGVTALVGLAVYRNQQQSQPGPDRNAKATGDHPGAGLHPTGDHPLAKNGAGDGQQGSPKGSQQVGKGDGMTGGVATPSPGQLDPRVYRQLQPFSITERSGQPLTLKQLRGKVWIADFIFTRCPGMCPAMSLQMKLLRDKLEDRPDFGSLRFVSISVDPDNDTPDVLTQYANRYDAGDAWLFGTGKREVVWDLIKGNFLLGVAKAKEEDKHAKEPIIHSPNFVLVDRLGRIRGYYNGLDGDARAKLLKDLDKVLAEKTPADADKNENRKSG